jgi:hypothetical protein
MIQTWPLRDAAHAAGVPPRKMQRWREHKVFDCRRNDKPPSGSGDPAGFSRRRIMQIAITRHLADLGMSPKRAAKAAFAFTDIDDQDRPACELHTFGQTVLIVTKDRIRVANTGLDLGIADFVPAAAFINLNEIVASVDAKLKDTNDF